MANAKSIMHVHKETFVSSMYFYEQKLKQQQEKLQQQRISKHPTKSRQTSLIKILQANESLEPKERNIFLYFQLKDALNVPVEKDTKWKIKLTNEKNTINKLDDSSEESNTFDLTYLQKAKPTFTLTVAQDKFDDLNTLSNNPLIITLMRTVKKLIVYESDSEERDTEEDQFVEHLEPVAQGYIDLLDLLKSKRSVANVSTFIYPVDRRKYDVSWPTCNLSWDVYSVVPLLKDVSITNILFITLESIYNASPDIVDVSIDIVVELSLQSKYLNTENEYDKYNICKFSMLTNETIYNQNINILWETLKSEDRSNANCLGVQSGCKVNLNKLFHGVLGTENVDFQFKEIYIGDKAMICNSMHRFVLTREFSSILEEAVAFNQQHIIVEVYKRDEPNEILLSGTLDLAILLYPKVNTCKFAVELTKDNTNMRNVTKTSLKSTKISKIKTANQSSISNGANVLPTFAIINICLVSPITEAEVNIAKMNEDPLEKEKLKNCTSQEEEPVYKSSTQVCEETYKNFDESVRAIIEHIIKNEVKTLQDAKKFFCCQLENLANQTMKLIACDFNIRFPTKTNSEFTNLMTTVYKELEARIYLLVQNCNSSDLRDCYQSDIDDLDRHMYFLNMIKYLYEMGDETHYRFIYEKLTKKYPTSCYLNFAIFLFDTEKGDFEAAKSYINKPLKLKEHKGEYFSELIDIYISYMENMSTPDTAQNALENLLKNLRQFTTFYRTEAVGWVLMHCMYSTCGYLPGKDYTRKQYEELFDVPILELFPVPKSRWELYNNYELTFQKPKSILFYRVVKLFIKLGMYRFAEIVFQEISKDCSELENYLMKTTFLILRDNVDVKYVARNFVVDKMPEAELKRAFLAQINGHLEYHRDAKDAAMHNYERILESHYAEHQSFQLSYLRYANHMFHEKEYEKAINAYEKICLFSGNCLIAQYGIGRAMYRLGRLEEAELYFSYATKYIIHIPDIWGYLALINLKLGNNFKALEFWKYAKINPNNIISDEILDELEGIKPSDVNLFVDKPN